MQYGPYSRGRPCAGTENSLSHSGSKLISWRFGQMQHYRDALPQLANRVLVTDGGLETTLMFLDGFDLPHFAAFPLLDTVEGRATLRRYYDEYGRAARRSGAGCLLDTPTFRASPEWAAKVGYRADQLPPVIDDAVALLREVRDAWETPSMPVVINGAIGPRGDGYSARILDTGEWRPGGIGGASGRPVHAPSSFHSHGRLLRIRRSPRRAYRVELPLR